MDAAPSGFAFKFTAAGLDSTLNTSSAASWRTLETDDDLEYILNGPRSTTDKSTSRASEPPQPSNPSSVLESKSAPSPALTGPLGARYMGSYGEMLQASGSHDSALVPVALYTSERRRNEELNRQFLQGVVSFRDLQRVYAELEQSESLGIIYLTL